MVSDFSFALSPRHWEELPGWASAILQTIARCSEGHGVVKVWVWYGIRAQLMETMAMAATLLP